MIIGGRRFNLNLLLLAALALACGCRSTGDNPDKQASTLQIHLEVVPDMMDFSEEISVFREHPVTLHVDKGQLLSEADVAAARVVDDRGGFALQIQFNRHGSWLLEEYTTANVGRHLAVFSSFGKGAEHSRWLAAPRITRRISDGLFTFTPDATRAEAERIALGLNNVAKKVRDHIKWYRL